MGSLGEAVLDLTADPSKLDPGLSEGKSKVTGALDGLKGMFGEATGTMLGQLSAVALQNIGAGIVSVGKDIMSSALSAEQSQAQLNAVLESTGGQAGVTASQVNELANSLSQVTMFEDDAIVSGESMLLTFTNIGSDVFPSATQTMLDMSQALGQDLTASAMQLGKALNDPVQGVTALRRVGVQLTDDQEELIKKLVETGDVAGAQKIILEELQKEFGGSAEAAGQTMAGQLQILNNEFDNVKEDLGTAFLPVLKDLVGIAKDLMPYLQQAVQWFSSLPTPVKDGAAAVLAIVAALAPLIGVISSVVSIVGVIGPGIAAVGGALAPILPIILTIIAVIALLAVAWKFNFMNIQGNVKSFVSIIKDLWNALLAFLRGDTTAALGYLKSAWGTYVAQVQSNFQMISSFVKTIWDGFLAFLKNAWQAAWTAVVSYFAGKVADIVGKAKELVNMVKAAFAINWSELGKRIIDGIVNGLKNGVNAVVSMAKSVAMAAFNAVKSVLGIHSPSAAFAELGNFSALGFAQGFAKSMTPQAVSGTLQRVVTGTAQTLNRTSSTNVNIYNPQAEPSSRSLDNTMKRLSYLGVLK